MAHGSASVTRLLLCAPFGALAFSAATTANAASPTYYDNSATFLGDLSTTVTDDYSDGGYGFIQNNATMSNVLGETDYESTGLDNQNTVFNSGGDFRYCSGCTGSFRLSFQTTSVGTGSGVIGAGFFVESHDLSSPYVAFVTFADGTTENVALPAGGNFWGVTAAERIESIHIGLPGGVATTSGNFAIDDLVVGDGVVPDSDCCSDSPMNLPGCLDLTCEASVCAALPFCCDTEWDNLCAFQAEALCPAVCNSCGNGVVADGEECDDGGESATCNADCTFAECGDLQINASAGEDCDEGGIESATCDANCTAVACGDGDLNLTVGEICDGGGETVDCDTDCTPAECGDLTVNNTAGETCDDGARSAGCNADCTTASCGDGVLNATAGEICDAGGESAECDVDCTVAECGDAVVNATAGEACDTGAESVECNDDCTVAACGDGILNTAAGENCDDGGETATCDIDCTVANCGDGVVNTTAGEECDDSGESAECDDNCTVAECGDGVINVSAGEECEDTNTEDGDGCSSQCTIERDSGSSSGGGSTGDSGNAEGDTTAAGGDTTGDDANDETATPGSTSTTGSTGATGSGDTADAAEPAGGCNCSTSDEGQTPGVVWSLLALFGFGAARRRRRRAA